MINESHVTQMGDLVRIGFTDESGLITFTSMPRNIAGQVCEQLNKLFHPDDGMSLPTTSGVYRDRDNAIWSLNNDLEWSVLDEANGTMCAMGDDKAARYVPFRKLESK
ncbi:hypothetical protein [Bifidobacterium oedipodis]|uniref:Uncharacterized protein n=1 Tax=Bifidobacterium oedipodis TaxID=2675322 RepID=A0A7Y0EQ22_9BIFI|nr:hypothetical protein [Bifidobacterium sp. DSM 109957]NMM93913.1 hypothetical protein [Bifidobacterium sp. DSM 109957]